MNEDQFAFQGCIALGDYYLDNILKEATSCEIFCLKADSAFKYKGIYLSLKSSLNYLKN